jgi:hypothetical protein
LVRSSYEREVEERKKGEVGEYMEEEERGGWDMEEEERGVWDKDKERCGIRVTLLSANQMTWFKMPQIVCFFGCTVSHRMNV